MIHPPARALLVVSLVAVAALVPGPALRAEDAELTCFDCHDIDLEVLERTVHGMLDCGDCHADVDRLPHDETLLPVQCSACHDTIVAEHAGSVHGNGSHKPGLEAPSCLTCHGPVHELLPRDDPASWVNPVNQAATCGKCHANPDYLAAHGVLTVRPIEAYAQSVHARAVAEHHGGATCSSCHTSHNIQPTNSLRSTVSHWRVQETCAQCHEEIAEQYAESIHGRALADGIHDSPVCTDCHGEHRILSPKSPGSPVYATNVPLQTCGRCHGDVRLNEKYGMSEDKFPAYEDSYHGLASRAGIQTVAHCGSCHGVHDIQPSSHPASHIHPDNLAETCGQCHAGAGERFAIAPVHIRMDRTRTSVAYYVRMVYLPMIFIVIGGMFFHNLVDLVKKARHPHPRPTDTGVRVEERMPLGFRIAHALVMVSFIVLVITGFALVYPEAWWAAPWLSTSEGTDIRATIHRGASIVMIAALVFHLVHVIVERDARRRIAKMIPRLADLRELRERMAFNLGLSEKPPEGVKVGYIEKSEYWAFMWGSVIMILSGFALWFEEFTLRYLPGWTVDLATSIHFYEAVLATLAIVVWHFYWVLLDPMIYPMDTTWITGRPPLARAEERGEILEGDEADGVPETDRRHHPIPGRSF